MGAKCSSCDTYMADPYMEFTEDGQRWAFCADCADEYHVEKVGE